MTYQETLAYIHNINWCFCKPGLERTRELCEKLGNPQKELRYIHVAGTNGKGSTCAMLESILRAAGLKTGLYTSPYVRRFNERMQVNGEPISDEELIEITEHVRPIADSMTEKPTEFELITAIAFEYFYPNRQYRLLQIGSLSLRENYYKKDIREIVSLDLLETSFQSTNSKSNNVANSELRMLCRIYSLSEH